jgi:miniconductance mechanosensitive channel
MYDFFYNRLIEFELSQEISAILSYMIMSILIALVCYLVHNATEFIIKKLIKYLIRYKWIEILFERKFFHHLSNTLIPVIISLMGNDLPSDNMITDKLAEILALIVAIFLVNSLIDSVDKIYHTYAVSKVKPLRSLFQVIKTIFLIVSVVVGISVLAGQNPINLIGGIGAVAAIVSFIFKDAILGFVSGLQLISNDLIRIGDWIEIPKHNANGTVIELSMTTVKVENFDRSFTSIPAYALISDAFINWRSMQDSGSRRIKRAIYIDAQYIKFLEDKKTTNLGSFREYALNYINSHPGINHNIVSVVRQLDSNGHGIPIEIYAFANTHVFDEYEFIQSTIFEHLYAVVPDFGLKVYQWSDDKYN